ncbi:LuxR family transcriptional regulator [soil metagenome]
MGDSGVPGRELGSLTTVAGVQADPGGARGLPGVDGMLVEREQELATLARVLDSARAGRGAVVVVHGPAGIGKTELLRAGMRAAREQGVESLGAIGAELEQSFPFGVALQLFERRVATADSAERDLLLTGAARLARPLLEGSVSTPLDTFAVSHGLHWLASNLSERSPLLLVVDDAQWADRPSLEALGYLAARIVNLPAVLAVGLRTGRAPLDDALERLVGVPVALRMRPHSLTPEAVALLITQRLGAPDGHFVTACHEASRGNPFLLGALLARLAEEGTRPDERAADRVGAWAPSEVLASLVARLRRLDPAAGTIADALALVGDRSDPELVVAVSGIEPDLGYRLISELVDADLMELDGVLSFTHPIIRSTLAAQVAPDRARSFHRRAVAQLRAAGSPEERIAPHLLHVAPAGEQAAVATLVQAATQSSAHGDADRALVLLRRAIDEPPPPEWLPDILAQAASAASRVDDPGTPALFERAVDAQPRPEQRVQLQVRLARRMVGHGRVDEAVALLERARQDDHRGDPALLRRLDVAYVETCRYAPERRRRSQELLERLIIDIGRPETREERSLLANAAYERSISTDDRDGAAELARRALGPRPKLTGNELTTLAFYSAAYALRFTEHHDGVDDLHAQAVLATRHKGTAQLFALASVQQAQHLLLRGRLSEAIAGVVEAYEAAAPWESASPAAGVVLCNAHLLRGEVDAARKALDRFSDETRFGGDPTWVGRLHGLGMVALAQGRPDEALKAFLACGEWQSSVGATNAASLKWRSGVARASLALGDRRQARELAEEEVALCRAFGAPGSLGLALTTLARVGDHEDAATLAEEAVACLADSIDAIALAQAQVLWARAQLDAGHPDGAREQLLLALRASRETGATVVEAEVVAALGALGVRVPPADRGGRDALTPSQLKVARMAADGLTNREIAEQSFVTLGAVEFHLGNV